MCALLFNVFKPLLLRKTDVLKLVEKVISRKENLKKCTSFEEQKGTSIFGKTFILALLSSPVFRLQNRVSDFF